MTIDQDNMVEQVMLPDLSALYPMFNSNLDPMDIVSALSQQMPIVEDSSPINNPFLPVTSHQSRIPHGLKSMEEREEGKVYNVTWWRPHGDTAIAPGMILKESC